MKKIIFIIVLLSLVVTSCTVTVIPDEPEPEEISCPDVYNPVCCDSKTYANDCFASIDGFKDCSLGECEDNCVPDAERVCTEQYDPFCCDGVEYSNYCFAEGVCAKNCIQGTCS